MFLGYTNYNMSSWTICKRVCFRDDLSAAVKAHVDGLARSIAYSGSIQVEIHTPPLELDVLPEEHTAVIRAEWSLGSPFIPTEQSWNMMVMNAMVDRKKGTISVNDRQTSHGMSPLRRAMRSNNTSTVISQEQNEEGFKHRVVQYSKWGSDS
jgi:hypothetical protein